MKVILFFVSLGFCQECSQIQLDSDLIRDDSQKAYCWSRPDFQKWISFHHDKRNVSLTLITDQEYYYQPNSGRYFGGQIFKPKTFMPVYLKLNSKNVITPLVDSDIEFLVTDSSCIVRMQSFKTNKPVVPVAPCKLPPNAFKCIANEGLKSQPEWNQRIHQCIPTEQSTFPISNTDDVLAINLVMKNKPGCVSNACFKMLSLNQETKTEQRTMIKYSKLRGEWRHVFRDQQKRVIIARKKDNREIPCPFDLTENKWLIDE